MDDALGHRAEAFRILRLAADAHGEERAAMERLRERDDFEFVRAVTLECDPARQLQRGFVRFGARVGEERTVRESQVFETFGEAQHRLVGVAIADVPQLAALLVQHFQQLGMRMTERGAGNAAGEVDIVAALRIPDARAETAIRHEGRGRKHRHHDFVEGLACHSQGVHGKSSLQVRGNTGRVGTRTRYVLRIRDAFYELPRGHAICRAYSAYSAYSGRSISAPGRGSLAAAPVAPVCLSIQLRRSSRGVTPKRSRYAFEKCAADENPHARLICTTDLLVRCNCVRAFESRSPR